MSNPASPPDSDGSRAAAILLAAAQDSMSLTSSKHEHGLIPFRRSNYDMVRHAGHAVRHAGPTWPVTIHAHGLQTVMHMMRLILKPSAVKLQ